MTPQERTDELFDIAKKLGLENRMNGDGSPTRTMVAAVISEAERDIERFYGVPVALIEGELPNEGEVVLAIYESGAMRNNPQMIVTMWKGDKKVERPSNDVKEFVKYMIKNMQHTQPET